MRSVHVLCVVCVGDACVCMIACVRAYARVCKRCYKPTRRMNKILILELPIKRIQMCHTVAYCISNEILLDWNHP